MNLAIPNDILTVSEMSEADLKLELAIILYEDFLLTTMLRTFRLISRPCVPPVVYDDWQ